MYLSMKRILLLAILTSLKIAVILANSVHSSFLCICKVIVDIFQLTAHLENGTPSTEVCSTQTIPQGSNTRVSTSVQTEEEMKQHENAEKKSSTDVIIYNLNSTQKLVITQGKFKAHQCESCKSAVKVSSLEKFEDVTAPTVGFEGSNISNMSIESDILDSKIENGCSSSSTSWGEKASSNAFSEEFYSLPVDTEDFDKTLNNNNDKNKSLSADFENLDNASLNTCNDRFSVSDNFECSSDNTYIKCNGTALHMQKTSSPLTMLLSSQTPCTSLSVFNDDQQYQINENKETGISANSGYWEKDTWGKGFKRRLSLPVKLNTTNSSVINFKLAQKKFIEDALRNTSRQEKSFKEIKYPFSSEISLESRPNDEMEDKEVFSCSSYESLPVSDHLRNALENNTLLNLYNENLHSEDKPDFSSVNNLVEAFNDTKSSLSVANLAQSKKTQSSMSEIGMKKAKGYESLNIDENLQPSSFYRNSLDGQILKDCQNLSNNYRDTQIDTNIGKRMASNFTSEINSGTTMADMSKVLDKTVTSEVKHVSEKYSRLFDKDELRNSVLKSDDSSQNNELSEMSKSSHFTAKENESFEKSNLMLESEEENNPDENKLYQMTSSPLHSTLDFENTLSPKDKVKTNKSDNLNKVWQQSTEKIDFISESPSPETIRSNQNISKTSCQDHSLHEDGKLMMEDISSSNEYDNLVHPALKQPHKSFAQSIQTNKNKQVQMKCTSSKSPNKSMISDMFECTGEVGSTVLSLKDKVETNKLSNNDNLQKICQQPLKASPVQSPSPKTISMNRNISDNDQKSTLRENIFSRDSDEYDSDYFPFPARPQYYEKTFNDHSSLREKNCKDKTISETNCQDHNLNEDRKHMQHEKPYYRDLVLKTNESNCDNPYLLDGQESNDETVFVGQHSKHKKIHRSYPKKYDPFFPVGQKCYHETAFVDRPSIYKKIRRYRNFSKANYPENRSLNAYEKPTQLEDNTSSGDSASDISIVTVKDLSVSED